MLSVTVILLSKIQNHPTNQFVGNLDKLYIAGLFLNRLANYPSFGGSGAFPFFPLGQRGLYHVSTAVKVCLVFKQFTLG